MESEERIRHALQQTEILKAPRQLIPSGSSSTLHYYVLSEPAYLEVMPQEGPETKIREGKLTWEQPRLMTPGYILGMEGFSDEAREAFKMVANNYPDLAGLVYKFKYRKEDEKMITVSNELHETSDQIGREIDEREEELAAVIKGVDELWDVSLSSFIQELIIKSACFSQLPSLRKKGLIRIDDSTGLPMVTKRAGIPLAAREEIEELFRQVAEGEIEPIKLKQELDRWGVFRGYEDRFFDLFRD